MNRVFTYRFYRTGKYKYRLNKTYTYLTSDFPEVAITDWIRLTKDKIVISEDYAWDGASGPAIDTKDFMRGSLIHDALYQLIREEWLDPKYRKKADLLLYRICREDGMSWMRAQWVYRGLRMFGSV